MNPKYPRILKDRDNYRRYYLDEDVTISLPEGSSLTVGKGYRFDGHSVPFLFRLFFPKYNSKDIYCALIHDALVDFESMHRYNRAYIDYVYKMYMNSPEYKSNDWRAFWMPCAVSLWGFLRFTLWGDYRGNPYSHTRIVVKCERDIIN